MYDNEKNLSSEKDDNPSASLEMNVCSTTSEKQSIIPEEGSGKLHEKLIDLRDFAMLPLMLVVVLIHLLT